MPKSYQLLKAIQFPYDKTYQSKVQLTLEGFEENAETRYSHAVDGYHKGFDQYDCYHDLTVRKNGRVYGKSFTQYLEPHSFPMFFNRSDSLILLSAPRSVSEGFLNVLNNAAGHTMEQIAVDYRRMQPKLPFITGAWFSDINQQNLKTAGYFGPNVDQSEQFRQAAAAGQTSTLMVMHTWSRTGDEQHVSITRQGAIVLYDRYSTTEDEIDMVLEVYNAYMV